MMASAMRILMARHRMSYLVTQAFRLPAIRLYLAFGFVPDIPDDHARRLWDYVGTRIALPK
jgi:hypothetical protein